MHGRLHCGVCLEEKIRHVNTCRLRFSLAPTEYCVSMTDALCVPLLHDIALPGYTRVGMLHIIFALYNALI
jgi:hypothetical protein